MSNSLISVILPVYNMEKYLSRCLDSILDNTYQNLQILCVDDGSRDSSLEILRRYESKDRRVSVITKENGGLSSARNAGLAHAAGDYISYIDPDDFVHPQFFELLLQALQDYPEADISMCAFQMVEDRDLPLKTEHIEFSADALQVVSSGRLYKSHTLRSYCWNRLYRAELALKARFLEDLCYSEDNAYVAALGEHKPDVTTVALSHALYYYYQRENSLSRVVSPRDRLAVARLFVQKLLQSPANEPIYMDQGIKRCLSLRYLMTHILPDKEIAGECGRMLKACRGKLRRTEVYSVKEKMILGAMIRVPSLYWLYRSVTEPYMWRWERIQRKKRREEKRRTASGVSCRQSS